MSPTTPLRDMRVVTPEGVDAWPVDHGVSWAKFVTPNGREYVLCDLRAGRELNSLSEDLLDEDIEPLLPGI